jgi:hypothetical protein
VGKVTEVSRRRFVASALSAAALAPLTLVRWQTLRGRKWEGMK